MSSDDHNQKRILSINISRIKGVRKEGIDKARIKKDHGIVGDAHAGKGHRQVSFLDRSSFDKMEKKGIKVECGGFGENITTEGFGPGDPALYELPVGAVLKVGEARFEVTQIGKVCHRPCSIGESVGECVMPKEGIFARVLDEGPVVVGDLISQDPG